MNCVKCVNNTTNDDDINNEGKCHIMSDIYMFLNIIYYLEYMVCKKEFEI